MKKITFTIIVILFTFSIEAQNDTEIQKIKKYYSEVKADIAFSEKNKSKSKLYCNRLVENVNNMSWSAVGKYHYDIRYWFFKDPSKILQVGADPHNALNMVILNGQLSNRKFYIEYLYCGQDICFALYKSQNNEVRLYFKDKKLIKQIGEFDKYTTDADEIVKHSAKCMKTFLACFGI